MRFSEEELHELERVGAASFAELHAALARHRDRPPATRPTASSGSRTSRYQVEEIDDEVELIRRFGGDAVALDAEAVRREVATPRALGGSGIATGEAGRPRGARLRIARARCSSSACGSARARRSRGARGVGRVVLECPAGRVRARRVVLATSAYPPLVRSVRRRMLPVYDYVLMTERLSESQLAAIGWATARG